MSSDVPVSLANTQLVQGSRPSTVATGLPASGKSLPQGKAVAAGVATSGTVPESSVAPSAGARPAAAPVKPAGPGSANPPTKPLPDLHAILAQLNRHLQSSGRLNQYRLDSSSGRSVIEEINPDTKQVLSEIPASEFRALAQELGVSGLLVDTQA